MSNMSRGCVICPCRCLHTTTGGFYGSHLNTQWQTNQPNLIVIFCPFQKHRDCAPPSPLNKQKSEKYLTEKDNRNGGYPPPPLPANPAWLRVPFPVTLYSRVTMNVEIVVLNCQKCNQCLTCHMSHVSI